MRLLLDSHAFLWRVKDDPALTRRARAAIADPDNECFLSQASIWEMAIKASLGKLRLASVEGLPFHHRDPFGRLLVAQARHEDMALVSRDPSLKAYGVSVI
jgi:PIN domain nuclease of toxin-antitoxin system